MSNGIPSVLFRFWSAASEGGLKSGKLRRGESPHDFTTEKLHQEFRQHRNLYNRTPTAFVSTTSNFLRVLHGAYKKMWRGEDSRQIMIAFLTPTSDAQTTIHHTKELAFKTGSSENEAENFEHEYIFLWEVPDDNVIHIVSMDLVVRRALALPEIWTAQAFLNLSDLRRAIEDHGYELSPLERGYLCGVIACTFGVRAPVHEIAFQMSRWARRGNHARKSWEIIDQAIEEAIQDRKITVAEDLDIEAEKAYLMFELSCLEDAHDETVMEIGWALQDCDHAGILQAQLASEELKILGNRQSTADQIETMCQMVGL